MDKKAIKKAIEDKPEPTPGFMIENIAKMTFEGTEVMEKVADFLVSSLKKTDSPHALVKILKLIKALCERGHPDFRKEIQRAVETLRSCATLRGKPDPIHGDKLNQNVREAATQAIEASFASNKGVTILTTQAKQMDISGQGSNTTEGKDSRGFKTGTVINPATSVTYKDNAIGAISSLKSAAQNGFGLFKQTERDAQLDKYATNQYGSDQQYVAPAPLSPNVSNRSTTSAPAAIETQQFVSELILLQPSEKVKPEVIVVEKFLKGKIDLTRMVCNDFVNQAVVLDVTEICGNLDDYLDEKQGWQVRLRSLTLIEALLNSQNQLSINYFTSQPEDIMRNTMVVQDTLKEKAQKILTRLGLVQKREALPSSDDSNSIFGDMQWKSSTSSDDLQWKSLVAPAIVPSPLTLNATNSTWGPDIFGMDTKVASPTHAVGPTAMSPSNKAPAVPPPVGTGKIKTRSAVAHSPKQLGTPPGASPFGTAATPAPFVEDIFSATLSAAPMAPQPAPKAADFLDDIFK